MSVAEMNGGTDTAIREGVPAGLKREDPVLIITDGGYAWMIVGADGKPVLYEFSQVIVLGKPSVPLPPPKLLEARC